MERKKCKCNFSSLWVTKSYSHASNEIAFHWHSIMDTKSFLRLLWDWCWTHTGTDVFVWLWVYISIVCHAVTFLLFPLSILFFSCFLFFFSVSVYLCFVAVLISFFFQCLGAFWLVWDFESVPPNLCICSNPKRLISAVQLCDGPVVFA